MMQNLLSYFDSIWAFALLVLGFGFVIFVHELGHFAVAKWVGVKVTQFAIGFGPSALSWRQGVGFTTGTTEPEYERRIDAYVEEHKQAFEEEDQRTEPSKRPTLAVRKDQARRALGLGETEYRLNWLPLGGYVKMLGQEDLNPDAAIES
jgi:regulator of sigma E protease